MKDTHKMVGLWGFPEVENLLGRREVTKSTFEGRWGLPQQLRNEFKKYELGGGLYIQAFGRNYEAKIFDTLENLNLDFSASSLTGELAYLLKEEKEFLYSDYKKRERKRLPEGKKVFIDLYKQPHYIGDESKPRWYDYVIQIYRQQPEKDESIKASLGGINEEELETIFNLNMSDEEIDTWLRRFDGNAEMRLKEGLQKIRVFQKKVISDLKQIYNGCCQICGYSTVKEYMADTSEAHHIEHFSKSCNNSPNNIIILCPNHHRLIHRLDFKYKKHEQRFISDEVVLEIKIDSHLKYNIIKGS